MTTRRKRDFLKTQLLETDRLIEMTGDHPVMSYGLAQRKEALEEELQELFEEDQLADTLAHVTRLIESAGRSDEDFATALDETSPRVVQSLRDFLKVVAEGKAGLQMESGDFRCTLDPIKASEAFQRVSDTVTKDEEVQEIGVFRGLLLESWRFDFFNEAGQKITGKLDDHLSQEQAVEMGREYLEKRCVADLLKTTILFKNGRVRTSYQLRELKAEG